MLLDDYLSPHIREQIEQRFYARVNENGRLENLIQDPTFLDSEQDHIGLFSDHGVVHVRDIATQIVGVLTKINGVLIHKRSAESLEMMKQLGVLLAYFHDIGMFDFSRFGRTMHPEFAAQIVFNEEMDALLEAIWHARPQYLQSQLAAYFQKGNLLLEPKTILRELLSLSVCHSKSKVQIDQLNDAQVLRKYIQHTLSVSLSHLYDQTRAEKSGKHLAQLDRYYSDFAEEGFVWLAAAELQLQTFREDVIDTLRALRCADSLRQRGTVLKTSGGYEIFVDKNTAKAIYAFRLDDDHLFLIERPSPHSVGEANLASSELDPDCNLRVSFHRGAFAHGGEPRNLRQAARPRSSMTFQQDVIGSFLRPRSSSSFRPHKSASQMKILLEETEDDPEFIVQVRANLLARNLKYEVKIVPSLQNASELERNLYLMSPFVAWDKQTTAEFFMKIEQAGHPVQQVEAERAFQDVKLVKLAAGETLLRAGAPASFVYFPLGPGLEVVPLGGYASFRVQPWMPLGLTGVIRGADRNADVRARENVELLMIPKQTYLRRWHATHTAETFTEAVERALKAKGLIE